MPQQDVFTWDIHSHGLEMMCERESQNFRRLQVFCCMSSDVDQPGSSNASLHEHTWHTICKYPCFLDEKVSFTVWELQKTGAGMSTLSSRAPAFKQKGSQWNWSCPHLSGSWPRCSWSWSCSCACCDLQLHGGKYRC